MFQIAMERVAKGEYILPKDVPFTPWEGANAGVRVMRFSKGQPLGAGPSFALFALGHHALVQGCSSYVPGGDQYRILGDDIVISDDRLAAEYMTRLRDLKVPISESKSISSGQLAEFAGFFIRKDIAYQPWKWRKISDENYVSVLRNFRRFPAKLLTRDQREIAERLWTVLEPFGFGHNPKGIPYSNRYALFLEIVDLFDSLKKDVTRSSLGKTWDDFARRYGTTLEHSTPVPRQAGLQITGTLFGSELASLEVPVAPESMAPGLETRVTKVVRSLLMEELTLTGSNSRS